MVYFTRVLQEVKCPVPGFPSVVHSAVRLHKHLMYRHLKSKVVLVQVGTETLPYYNLCGIHIPAGRLIRHRKTAHCDKKNSDEVEEAGCGDCSKVLGGIIQPNRGEGGGTHQGGGGVQIPRTAIGLVR